MALYLVLSPIGSESCDVHCQKLPETSQKFIKNNQINVRLAGVAGSTSLGLYRTPTPKRSKRQWRMPSFGQNVGAAGDSQGC